MKRSRQNDSPAASAVLACAISIGTMMISLAMPSRAHAQQLGQAESPSPSFQVSFETWDQDSNRIIDRHWILFHGEKIYDISRTEPHDVMIIDMAAGTTTLLSRRDQIKATFPHQDILAAAAVVRVDAKNKGFAEKLGLNAKPQRLPKTKNEMGQRYQIESFGVSYQAKAVPAKPEFAQRFNEFTNWAARLNIVRRLVPRPPFTRMQLGNAFGEDEVLPETIDITFPRGEQADAFRQKFQFQNSLDQASIKRIAEVDGMLTLYKDVSPAAFPK